MECLHVSSHPERPRVVVRKFCEILEKRVRRPRSEIVVGSITLASSQEKNCNRQILNSPVPILSVDVPKSYVALLNIFLDVRYISETLVKQFFLIQWFRPYDQREPKYANHYLGDFDIHYSYNF